MKKECGQALILVLILLGVGATLTIALLQSANTMLKTRQIYGKYINEDYAADAAVEYGMWRLKHEPGFAETLPIGTESDPFYVTLNGVTANTTILSQALEIPLSGQELAGRADDEIFFKVEKTVVATSTYQSLAIDGFESGDGSGGTGNWTGNWTLSGDYSFSTYGEHEGSYHLMLRGDGDQYPGDGYAQRQVDLSGSAGLGPFLQFWARMDNFESDDNDTLEVKVSTNGADWDVLEVFDHNDDDAQYHQYQYDLSSYGAPSVFYLAFDMNGDHDSDTFYVDDIRFTNSQETSVVEPGVLTVFTYNVSFQCLDPDGCYSNPGDLDRIVDELPARGTESGDYMTYVNGSTEWDVVSFASYAFDGFESGDGTGGTGNWTGDWTLSGDYSFLNYGQYAGYYHLSLRGDGDQSPGDGYAEREIDLSSYNGSGAYLYFWARISDVESGNTIDVRVSTNGEDWNVLETFDQYDSDNQYHQHWYDLSGYGSPSSFFISFKMNGDHYSDTIYIDNIEFSAYQGAINGEWPVPPFDPSTTIHGSGSDLYQELEWDFEDAGYYDIPFYYGEIKTMSFKAQAALTEGTYCNRIWVSDSSSGDEGQIISGTTAKIVVGDPEETACSGGLVEVTKTSDPEVAYPYQEETVTYTIQIKNVDTDTVTIYAVEDWLPATGSTEPSEGFIYVDDSAYGRIIRPSSIAFDGFETANGYGGTGNWTSDWTFSGNSDFSTSGEYQGVYHLRLRGDSYPPPGDGFAYRAVDLSGSSTPSLRFFARMSQFESGDEVDVLVSTDPPIDTSVAFDGFESGDGTGGTGTWNGNWSFSGGYSVTGYDWPYQGSEHLRLQNNTAYAQREVHLSGTSNASLKFYAKLSQLEYGDEVDVEVSTNGVDWDVLHTFENGDDDNQYHAYIINLAGYGSPSTFYIAFDSNMNTGPYDYDYFYVDNVELFNTSDGSWDVLHTFEDGDDNNIYDRYDFDLSSYGSPSTFYVAFDASGLSSDEDYFYVDNVEFLDPTAEGETPVCMPDEDGNEWWYFTYEDWAGDWPYYQYRWSVTWNFYNYPDEESSVWEEGGDCEAYQYADYDPYIILHPGEIFEIVFQASGTLTYSGSYFNEVFVKIYEGNPYDWWDDEWVYSWPTGTVIVPQYDIEAETLSTVLRANAMLGPQGHWWRSWGWWRRW